MDALARKIGQISINFASIEKVVVGFVSKLITEDVNIGAIVTSEMSFQNLLKAFDSLIRYKFTNPETLEKWDGIRKDLNTCEQDRNVCLHSSYLLNPQMTGYFRMKITAKQNQGLKVNQEDIDEEKLHSVVAKQAKVFNQLAVFYKEVFGNDSRFVMPTGQPHK